MAGGELVITDQRVPFGLLAGDHAPQLAPARQPEVEGGADALSGERKAVPGRVADEEDPAFGGGPQRVRYPVALVADGVGAEVAGEPHRRLAHVKAGIE